MTPNHPAFGPLIPDPAALVPDCPGCGSGDRAVLYGYQTVPTCRSWWCNRCAAWFDWLAAIENPPQHVDPEPRRARRKNA